MGLRNYIPNVIEERSLGLLQTSNQRTRSIVRSNVGKFISRDSAQK